MHEPFIKSLKLKREDVPRWDRFPFDLPVVRSLDTISLDQPLTVLVGENGSGKSTLLEAIAILAGLNPEGGTKNFNFQTEQTESSLDRYLVLVRGFRRERHGLFLRAETAFNLLTAGQGYGSSAWEGLHRLSHGEAFLRMIQDTLYEPGLLLLDEPEAGLSPARQLSTLRVIDDHLRTGTQVVLSTHSPILMAHPEAVVYGLSERGIERIDYRQTEHFQLMRDFLQRPESFLRHLFGDD